jgi:hypothetical protein
VWLLNREELAVPNTALTALKALLVAIAPGAPVPNQI